MSVEGRIEEVHATGVRKALVALVPPLFLLLVAAIAAQTVREMAGLEGWEVVNFYVSTWMHLTAFGVIVWILVEFVLLARRLTDNPLGKLWAKFLNRIDLILLPALIFPLFLACYTTVKTGIPQLVGFGWERFWADADFMLLGNDAWRYSWALLPSAAVAPLEYFYTMVWGASLVICGIIIALYSSRETTARYFTALMLAWLVGGNLMAYLTSAAGPVFVHLGDPSLVPRFAELHETLMSALGPESPIIRTQVYLEKAVTLPVIGKGGGISAMPSMHVATATMLVLVSWRLHLVRLLTLTFLTLTVIGSVHFGYHYLLDGVVGAAIAMVAWNVAGRAHRWLAISARPAAPVDASAAHSA